MTNDEINSIFAKYFLITKGSKRAPYIVLFDAMIGYGKSYVAKKLAELDGSIIISNNEVRYRLGDYADKYSDQWHELQKKRIKKLLTAGNSLIIDECLPINYQKKLDFYKGLGVPVYIIRLDCNKDVWAERVKTRKFNPPYEYSVIDYNDAVAINAQYPAHVPDELIDYAINTTNSYDIDVQLKQLVHEMANNQLS